MPKPATIEPSRLFRAFSDPTRLRLLHLLRGGEACVCDLVETLAIPQPTASRHLAALRRAGLVVVRKDGLWSYYALAEQAGGLRGKLIASLAECAAGMPELARDETRMKKVKERRSCC